MLLARINEELRGPMPPHTRVLGLIADDVAPRDSLRAFAINLDRASAEVPIITLQGLNLTLQQNPQQNLPIFCQASFWVSYTEGEFCWKTISV